jgi:hypothetical protein
MLHFLTKRDGGTPCSPMWVGEDTVRALLNLDTGHIHGYTFRVAPGKYGSVIFVSFRRALWVMRQIEAHILSPLPFPRCTVRLRDRERMDMAGLDVSQATNVFE